MPIEEGQTKAEAIKEHFSKAEKKEEIMLMSANLLGSQNSELDGLTNAAKSDTLIHSSSAMTELYGDIVSGKYYTPEELEVHPAVLELEAVVAECDKKYGKTSKINTPERQAQRRKWQNLFLSSGSARKNDEGVYVFDGTIKREHKAVIVIGLPASGKSTMVANPTSEKLGAFIFDSDEIKELIPEFIESNGGAANAVHKESGKIRDAAFAEFLAGSRNGDNLVIPTIGSDLQKKYISKLETAGYDVEVKYQDANPTESLNRVYMRAIKTGRIIPARVVMKYGNKPRSVFDALKVMKGIGGKPYVRG